MNSTYNALAQSLPIPNVGPDGRKRSIRTFPKVGSVRGLEAFALHLPFFLGRPRGSEPTDPESGSSLYLLLDTEDARRAAEIVQRVVHEEIPGRFGKYLDAIHAFEVTIEREARKMGVSLALKPHDSEVVSWRFELDFPGAFPSPPPAREAVHDSRAEELIRVARYYYPAGFPAWEDDDEEPVPAYQRTPEYQRWSAIREKTWEGWKEWQDFLAGLRSVFPGQTVRNVTYPSGDACCLCCVYLESSSREGGRVLTRIVGAVSILAPLYLVYVTTETVRPDKTSSQPQLVFTPTGEVRAHADTVARHIEAVFGYRPFPLELADVPLPDLRVESLNEPPTLLSALFASRDRLANLP